MPTVEEIDEALAHANAVPLDQRGTFHQRWVDSLLDQPTRLAAPEQARRTTRVLFISETR